MVKKDFIIAYSYIAQFLESNKKDTLIRRRLAKKTLKPFTIFIEEYQDQEDDLKAKFSVKGDKKEIIYDSNNQYAFTEEGRLEYKKAIKVLKEETLELEIEKVDWELFSDDEKKWVALDDEYTYKICEIFISGLPPFNEEI